MGSGGKIHLLGGDRMKKFALLLLLISVSGCSAIRLPSLSTPKKPETVYNWAERERVIPRMLVNGKGETYVANETERVLSVGLEQTPAKMTFIQRVGSWISGLGMVAIIGIIIGLVVAPGATIAILVTVVKKWKRALRQTVLAIKDSGALHNDNLLRNALSDRQEEGTKKIVAGIKAES